MGQTPRFPILARPGFQTADPGGPLGATRKSGLFRLKQPLAPLAALIIACAGLFATGVLSVAHLLDLPIPCGTSSDCLTIAAHPASKLFGVPIACFGAAAYATLIVLLGQSKSWRWAPFVSVILAGVGTVVSLGLLIYSKLVIQAACPLCIASGVGMALSLLLTVVLWRRARAAQALPTDAPDGTMMAATSILHPVGTPRPAYSPILFWGLLALTAAAIGLEAGLMKRAANGPPIPAERLAGLTVDDLVDPAKCLGPADAPVTIVVFSDLWCYACRQAHGAVTEYQRANSKKVRLAFRHRPLWEIRGHEFSGAAAALSEIAAAQGRFWPFIDAIFARTAPLDRDGYLRLMTELGIDCADAEARIADENDPATARVWQDRNLAERLGVHSTPTFIVLATGHPPVSATPGSLPGILDSTAVRQHTSAPD